MQRSHGEAKGETGMNCDSDEKPQSLICHDHVSYTNRPCAGSFVCSTSCSGALQLSGHERSVPGGCYPENNFRIPQRRAAQGRGARQWRSKMVSPVIPLKCVTDAPCTSRGGSAVVFRDAATTACLPFLQVWPRPKNVMILAEIWERMDLRGTMDLH